MLKYYSISVEGIDRAGKGQILKYIDILGNHKYVLMDRGIMSNIAYAKLYNRDYKYDTTQFKDWTFIYLICDKEDWEVRCKISNEPPIDYDQNFKAFESVRHDFEEANYDVIFINTSRISPYDAAKMIIKHMEDKNKGNQK